MKEAFDRLYTAGSKTAICYYKSRNSHYYITALNKTKAPKLLPDRYMLQPTVMAFRPRNFLSEVFDRKIQQLLEANLIEHYIESDNEKTFHMKNLKKGEQLFKVLTLDELKAGFVVSFAPLLLSLVVFCFEWLVTLKDLFVFLITFKTYFRMKKHKQDQQIELNKIKMAAWKIIMEEKAPLRSLKLLENYEFHKLQDKDCINMRQQKK